MLLDISVCDVKLALAFVSFVLFVRVADIFGGDIFTLDFEDNDLVKEEQTVVEDFKLFLLDLLNVRVECMLRPLVVSDGAVRLIQLRADVVEDGIFVEGARVFFLT